MRAFVLVTVTVVASGCGGRGPEGFGRFVPQPEPARRALAKALESWRQGQPPGLIEGTPKLLLIDARRQAGRKLASFEVLGEVPADSARGFSVRLAFEGDGPDEPPTSRFLIVGIDPLWVYRQEDFEMFCHWMHAMDEPEKGKP